LTNWYFAVTLSTFDVLFSIPDKKKEQIMKKLSVFLAAVCAASVAMAAANVGPEILKGKWQPSKIAKLTVTAKGVEICRTTEKGAWIVAQNFKPEAGATYLLDVEVKNIPAKTGITLRVRMDKETKTFKNTSKEPGTLTVKSEFTAPAKPVKNGDVSLWVSLPANCKESILISKCSLKKVTK